MKEFLIRSPYLWQIYINSGDPGALQIGDQMSFSLYEIKIGLGNT